MRFKDLFLCAFMCVLLANCGNYEQPSQVSENEKADSKGKVEVIDLKDFRVSINPHQIEWTVGEYAKSAKVKLQISGKANGKQVHGAVGRAAYEGELAGERCNNHDCSGYFMLEKLNTVQEATLRVVVIKDVESDGNSDKEPTPVTLGFMNANGNIVLNSNFTFEAKFVRESYSYLERLLGAEDAEYIALKVLSK